MNNIYLDYAATSIKHFDIFKDVINELENIYANPSSSHSLGKKNNILLKNARKNIAKSLNAIEDEIIFTSGGTEANNMVFNHIENSFSSGEIIISNIEHPSIINCAEKLESKGFKIIKLNVDSSGIININELEEKITTNTILISVMYANNETGIIQPIKEISTIAKKYNILIHSDIVQAYCKIPINLKELNIDFASVSAHKIGATNNFGFLYTKSRNIKPLIIGGGQEQGLRSGTSDIFGALVLSKCVDKTLNNIEYLKNIKNYFLEKLIESNIEFEINGNLEKSLPNILNIYFKNIESQRLITYLDINNIYISGGSACSSGIIIGSKIITAMYDKNRAKNSVRFSIGFNTTKEMIDIVINNIRKLEDKLLERR